MKHIKTLLFSLSALALLAVGSCKKEKCQDPQNPQCENYDPCFGKRTINTFFKVRPGDNGFRPEDCWSKMIQTDTFNVGSVRFDIPDNSLSNSTFSWQIGTEAQPRTGKAIEVDFFDYLRDNGWERHIPVTLTIRTPSNACLTNPRDTLVTVTRELFFTETVLRVIVDGKGFASFKGSFSHSPNIESTVNFIQLETGKFRGLDAPIGLVVGVPGIDTFVHFWKCREDYCLNYKHVVSRLIEPAKTGCPQELFNYLIEYENLFIDDANAMRYRWVFDKPSGREVYEFTGKRIE